MVICSSITDTNFEELFFGMMRLKIQVGVLTGLKMEAFIQRDYGFTKIAQDKLLAVLSSNTSSVREKQHTIKNTINFGCYDSVSILEKNMIRIFVSSLKCD